MPKPLRSLEVRGLRSIGDATLELTSGVTLLVGANGAGKSNLVGAFELLGHVVDQQVNDYVLSLGGFDRLRHRSHSGSEIADAIELRAWGDANRGVANGYEARLEPTADDEVLVDETSFFHDSRNFPEPYWERLGKARESRLAESIQGIHSHVFSLLAGCRVFHFDDTSSDAPPKKRTDVENNLTLMKDARNIAALLLRIRDDYPAIYRRVVRSIQAVAPFFDDFVLRPRGSSVLLRWRERGIDDTFSADALSDGTLRFICLTVLLQQPDAPSTIVLDEPELGLHPYAIRHLADQLREASANRRIVAATQSVTLMNEFSMSEVAIVERGQNGTVVTRPDENTFQNWFEDYSLGDLWQKNLLGGNPGMSLQG